MTSLPKPLNFALVGAGVIAQLRKRALDASEFGDFVGVFDINEQRAKDMAGDKKVYASLEDLLADNEVDAVIVSTPPHIHEQISVDAMRAGKHVLVEKPMAPTTEACVRMMACADAEGKLLTCGFNHRYFPAVQDVRNAITSGTIGKLNFVRGYAGHAGLEEFKAEWMYSKDVMGGGALMDNGIHMIDLVQHLMAPIKTVYGRATSDVWELGEVEDNGFAIMTDENGVTGFLNASWTEWAGYRFYVEAYGTKGMARAFYAPMTSMIVTQDKPGGKRTKKVNRYLPIAVKEKLMGWQTTTSKALQEEIEDFVRLADGQSPVGSIATAEAGMRSIQMAHTIYDSTKQKAAMEIVAKPEG